MGQLEEIADLMRQGIIQQRIGDAFGPIAVEKIEQTQSLLNDLKGLIGHQRNSSFGIANKGVSLEAKRAYEVKKVIDKAVADFTHPGTRHTVHHDGLLVRYTQDPAPTASIIAV